MKSRTIALTSAAIGAGFGVYLERSGHFSEHIFPTAHRLVNDTDRTRFVWPAVSARTIVPAPSGSSSGQLSRSGEIMKYGFPSMDNIRTFEDYVVSFDKRNKVPNWVFEHLTAEKVRKIEGVERKESKFFEDESMHEFFRASNDDYRKSGYDRGHLAAAANHRWSQKAMDQTFVLTNVAPQVGKGFNRDAWNYLEKFVRHLTKNYMNVYVCSGPLYLPRREEDHKLYVKYEVIGKNHVAVPTHFFKVVLSETAEGGLELLTFLLPNQPLQEKIDLKSFMVPLESIERAAGLLIFNGIPRDRLRKINGKKV